MLSSSTVALIPFVIAFVALLIRFYVFEHAASVRSPTFLLAVAAPVPPVLFLALKVMDITVPYLALATGVVGLGFCVAAAVRYFRV